MNLPKRSVKLFEYSQDLFDVYIFGRKSTDFIFALSQLITFLQNIQTQVRKTNVRKDVSIPRSRCRIFGNSNLTHFGCEVRVLNSSKIILEFRIRCLHVTAVQQKSNSTQNFALHDFGNLSQFTHYRFFECQNEEKQCKTRSRSKNFREINSLVTSFVKTLI